MSMTATTTTATDRPLGASLPLATGVTVYALLLAAGSFLLRDPDTY